MFKVKNSLIGLVGLVTLMAVATAIAPHLGYGSVGTAAPAPSTQNVNVVNTPTVSAQQTGPWSVGITGTPNINVANMPTVGLDPANNSIKVGNDAANPVLVRDIDNPAPNAVRLIAGGSFIDQGSASGAF